jgi:hypothetical protein
MGKLGPQRLPFVVPGTEFIVGEDTGQNPNGCAHLVECLSCF